MPPAARALCFALSAGGALQDFNQIPKAELKNLEQWFQSQVPPPPAPTSTQHAAQRRRGLRVCPFPFASAPGARGRCCDPIECRVRAVAPDVGPRASRDYHRVSKSLNARRW